MFSFQNNAALMYLWFLPILALLYFYYLRWRTNKLKLLGNVQLVQALLPAQAKNPFAKLLLFLLIIATCIFALAGPRLGTSTVSEAKQSKDILFCLDISNSMNSRDVGSTRLEKAKLFLQQCVLANIGNQMGLIVFAGNAYISVPLTLDVDALLLNIQVLSTDAITAQGTNIGAALKAALQMFNTKSNSGKSIVLITDGEDHEGDFSQALDNCITENISVNTIGVGQPQGIELLDLKTNTPMFDDNGQRIISKLDEQMLQKIANKSNGAYWQLQNVNSVVAQLNSSIKKLNGGNTLDNKFKVYNHYFQYALLPCVLLLILYLIWPLLYTMRVARGLKTILIISFLSISTKAVYAQNPLATQRIKEGKALYKLQKYPDAVTTFRSVLPLQKASPQQQSSALFNIGNGYCKQQQWQAAIENYKQSLAINPNNLTAKNNLVYAQKKLQQEQQKKEQGNKNNRPKPSNSDSNKAKPNNEPQAKEPQPQQTPSKLTQEQAKQLLDGLKQEEQKILKSKIGNNNPSQNKLRKDW
jgi:Mg-chelatase subunit ChlD